MNEVLLAIGIISLISLSLTVMILIVDATIGNYGECKIDINNGEKELVIEGGSSLLSSLNSEGIFIPSACGGKGSCGLCTLKVLEGGGDILPTETPWLDEEQIKDNVRLSCQVKVKQDIKIEIPAEFFLIKQFTTKVESIKDLTHDIKEVRLRLDDPPELEFKAGQFVQILTPVYEESSEEVYRAYSVSSAPHEKGIIEMQIRLVPNGICTTYVHNYLKEGDEMVVNGPYGDFYLQDTDREIVFVAGGSGMAPIKSILMDMKKNNNKRKATYFFGAVTKKDLFHVDTMKQFEKDLADFEFVPGLSGPEESDNWDGETGLITEVIDRKLKNGENHEAYLCGSPGMIDACVEVLKKKGIPEDLIFYDKFA
jgi:Na+-transporting NADH:ubiquinone oxidoreductase subunit F